MESAKKIKNNLDLTQRMNVRFFLLHIFKERNAFDSKLSSLINHSSTLLTCEVIAKCNIENWLRKEVEAKKNGS